MRPRPPAHPEAQHVTHGEFAGISQQLGDQQQGHQPGDQEADGVEETVVTEDRDGASDAQERGRGQVVAGYRDPVLRPGERSARRVVVGGSLGAVRSTEHDHQGDQHEEDEDPAVEQRRPHGMLG